LTTAQNFFFSQNETLLQKYASRDLEISPDNKIIFRMENALEESFLLAKRDFLLKEMKEATGRVFEMIFEMKKSTQPVVRRLDTNSAKLQYLLGKNPFLSDFIQKLGLSPD
jgi:hypothetical protein